MSVPVGLRAIGDLLKQAAIEWWNDNTFRLSASLAFYTVFSLAPIVLIATALAGLVFGAEVATGELVERVDALVGPEGGRAVEEIVRTANASEGSGLAALIGVAALLVGSTAVFAEMQNALNLIWDVKPDPTRGMVAALVRERVLSFALVLTLGFLLMVSLAADAFLAGARDLVATALPAAPWIWQGLHLAVSLGLVALLFIAIFKVLPDATIDWADVVVGGVVTALLSAGGKFAIGLYLGHTAAGSAYGTAGSFAVLLIWVYYSALVLYFGAELTHVYARRYGSRIEPAVFAARAGEKSEEATAVIE